MRVATYAAAGTNVINDNSLPENLILHRSASTIAITRIIVSVAGIGVIADLDQKGLEALTNNANLHTAGANIPYWILPLADGYHGNKRVTIEITHTGAGTLSVYYNSLQEGSMYIQTKREKVFANQPAKFTKFAQLAIKANAVTDAVNVTMENGSRHNGTVQEFQIINTKQSGQNFTDTTVCVIDNDEMVYTEVEYIPSADSEVFVTTYLIPDMAAVESKMAKLNARAKA